MKCQMDVKAVGDKTGIMSGNIGNEERESQVVKCVNQFLASQKIVSEQGIDKLQGDLTMRTTCCMM